jgi:GTP cyclohydrolase IA
MGPAHHRGRAAVGGTGQRPSVRPHLRGRRGHPAVRLADDRGRRGHELSAPEVDGHAARDGDAGAQAVALADGRIRPELDRPRAEAAVRELLIALGEDPDREGLRETPARVARAYAEIFAGLYADPDAVLDKTFDEGHRELVLIRDIPVSSFCEHHLLPFSGIAHVGYIPSCSGHITGLSKIARLVDLYARRPQVQERLTGQIADALVRKLDPRGVIVVVDAEHLCMAMRGIRKPGSRTTTSAVRGMFETSPSSRAEAMSLIRG